MPRSGTSADQIHALRRHRLRFGRVDVFGKPEHVSHSNAIRRMMDAALNRRGAHRRPRRVRPAASLFSPCRPEFGRRATAHSRRRTGIGGISTGPASGAGNCSSATTFWSRSAKLTIRPVAPGHSCSSGQQKMENSSRSRASSPAWIRLAFRHPHDPAATAPVLEEALDREAVDTRPQTGQRLQETRRSWSRAPGSGRDAPLPETPAVLVETPSMDLTPVDTSSTYTPGCSSSAMGVAHYAYFAALSPSRTTVAALSPSRATETRGGPPSRIPRVTARRVALPLVLASALVATGGATTQAPRESSPRLLRVSDNRRFLVTDDGRPFFWLGDTAWELFHRLTREDAIRYLDNRARLRFTVIQAVALAEFDGLGTPNAYGHRPLVEQRSGDAGRERRTGERLLGSRGLHRRRRRARSGSTSACCRRGATNGITRKASGPRSSRPRTPRRTARGSAPLSRRREHHLDPRRRSRGGERHASRDHPRTWRAACARATAAGT